MFRRRCSVAASALWVVACSHSAPPASLAKASAARPAPAEVVAAAATPAPAPRFLGKFEPGRAASERKAKLLAAAPGLDAFLQTKVEQHPVAGLAVGVVLEGELVYARGFGVQDLEAKTPIDVNSVFRIASLTKNFTALAVMQLRDAGKLDLDVPLATYLPEFAQVKLPTEDAPPITLRLLLTHASGLAWDDAWGSAVFGFSEQALASLLRAGLTFGTAPGTSYEYSNLGYALLGQVIERVSGLPFRQYMSENIFRPLGMRASVWSSGEVPSAHLAVGYRLQEGKPVPEPRPSDGVFSAGGGIYTSLADYARYVAFNLQAYPARDGVESGPLRRSSLREMHVGQRPARHGAAPVARLDDGEIVLYSEGYGFGWHTVVSCLDDVRVQHGGMLPGYYSRVMLLPKYGVGVVLMTTSSGPPGTGKAIGQATQAQVFELLRKAGVLPEPEPLPVSKELAWARDNVSALLAAWDPKVVERTFEPQNLDWFDTLRQDFQKLIRDHGACGSADPVKVRDASNASFRLRCERGTIDMYVSLTPARPPKVQMVWWEESFPASAALERTAQRLAAALGSRAVPPGLFAGQVAADRPRRALARLGLTHRGCKVAAELASDGHTQASFRLDCSGKPLEIVFSVDPKAQRVTEFSGGPPHHVDAACWQ